MTKKDYILKASIQNPTLDIKTLEDKADELIKAGYLDKEVKTPVVTKTKQLSKPVNQEAINIALAFLEHKQDYAQIKSLLKKKDKWEIALDWAKDIIRMNEIDWLTYPQITEICKFVCIDDFWAKNILSIAKLRKKNREWIAYRAVMIDNIKWWIDDKKEHQINEVIKKRMNMYKANLNKDPPKDLIDKWKEKVRNWDDILKLN